MGVIILGKQITKEQLSRAAVESKSFGELLRKLGYNSESGSRYPRIKR